MFVTEAFQLLCSEWHKLYFKIAFFKLKDYARAGFTYLHVYLCYGELTFLAQWGLQFPDGDRRCQWNI